MGIRPVEWFLDFVMCQNHLEDRLLGPLRLSLGLGRGLRTYTFIL